MEVALETFDDLLRAAREQPTRQRLLFVFAKAVLPNGARTRQVERFHARAGGALIPVMYADKAEYEVSCFEDLLAEAEHTIDTLGNGVETAWDMVIVGCLAGSGAEEVPAEEVDAALHDILQAMRLGKPLNHLVAFDREGNSINFE